MQTLRKKTSPLKYKNETTRFLGDGVSFKAKLIGILEVSEARGDRMCQEALSDLKMAIRAAGEHKQRITINIAIDGLRLRDEKTGDSLYHHPVHKISFIAQDMTDSRAFGYIFGSPDTGHRFFGIKTDKAASQVVIAMRDLFQVVFALKKKEIELAKQHLDKNRYSGSPMFTDTFISSSKVQTAKSEKVCGEAKTGTAVADLVDLELELNSLQQGLNQMEKITPSDPFGSKDDPFGDSFTSYNKPILPPPPSSGRERSSRTSETSSIFSPRTPHLSGSLETANSQENNLLSTKSNKDFSFSHEFNNGSSHDEPSSGDWFTPSGGNSFLEETQPVLVLEPSKDEKHEIVKQEILSQFDVFTELDPLGTGRSKPYIDKKNFFQELKNPPKKILNDLVVPTNHTIDPSQYQKNVPNRMSSNSDFGIDPFGEDPFVTEDPFAETDFGKSDDLFELPEFNTSFQKLTNFGAKLKSPANYTPTHTKPSFDVNFDNLKKDSKWLENRSFELSSESECAPEPPPRPPSTGLMKIKPPPLPPKKQATDLVSKPPPRPPHTNDHYDYMDNYETAPSSLEFIAKNDEKTPPIPLPARKSKFESDFVPERPRKCFNSGDSSEEYLTPISLPKGRPNVLLPLPDIKKSTPTKDSHLESKSIVSSGIADKCSIDGLDITLSQLTLSGLNELATKLKIPASQLSNMTLVQLTNYLSNFIKSSQETIEDKSIIASESKSNEFKADFAANFKNFGQKSQDSYDRYAVFRELITDEIKQTKIDTEPEEIKPETADIQENEMPQAITELHVDLNVNKLEIEDKYAALRSIVESELTVQIDPNQNVPVASVEACNQFNQKNEKNESPTITEYNVIEYNNSEDKGNVSPISPILSKASKSPIPIAAITEIVQNQARLTSGSLSDVISGGSSPEVDNTGVSTSEKKLSIDAAAESWAIFDQSGTTKDTKPGIQSEEGVSPWSSDSKEFNNSPPEIRSGPPTAPMNNHRDEIKWKQRRGHNDWWGPSSEDPQYYRHGEAYYDYVKQRRRKQGYGGASGGHSSSSRDVSPWEEEPRHRWTSRHQQRQHSIEKQPPHRSRHTDSWDDEEDEEEEVEEEEEDYADSRCCHRMEEWDDRRHYPRRRGERWCCPDWEQTENDKPRRYGGWSGEGPPPGMWRDRYYSRESQASSWEDEYSNEADQGPPLPFHYNRKNWKRPSSASEMERKTGEIKSRHFLAAGGSDGERDRRYKPGRRSRSRDSQYSEPPLSLHRHPKHEQTRLGSGGSSRGRKAQFEQSPDQKIDVTKKSATLAVRKKTKNEQNITSNSGTFPRKTRSASSSANRFDNEFVSTFENDFETSEAESPTIQHHSLHKLKSLRMQSVVEKGVQGEIKHYRRSLKESNRIKPKLLFEDDFSPSCGSTEKNKAEDTIESIKEEVGAEEDDFIGNNLEIATNSRKKKFKHRLSNDVAKNLKKSDSVNIFARESDPFDDDFFSQNAGCIEEQSPRVSDLKWTDNFKF